MKMIDKRKCILVWLLAMLFIAKRMYLMGFRYDSINEMLYYCFLHLGKTDGGLYFLNVLDFVIQQCIWAVGMGLFMKKDVLVCSEMVFPRVRYRKEIYFKESGKILLNAVIVYILVFFSLAAVVRMLRIRHGITSTGFHIRYESVMYFIYGMLLFCIYILLLNISTIWTDMKYILVSFIVLEVFFGYVIRIFMKRNEVINAICGYVKTGAANHFLYGTIPLLLIGMFINVMGMKKLNEKELV